jgi:hypothetical protein
MSVGALGNAARVSRLAAGPCGSVDLTKGPGELPELFAPGLVSGPGDQAGAVVGPGNDEIFFWAVERRPEGGDARGTIYVTRRQHGSWTDPEVVSFSGQYSDSYVALHPDGTRVYFQSDRPIDRSESSFCYNIWYADRQGKDWGDAHPIGHPINGVSHTGGPSATVDGTLYFTRMDLDSGRSEVYRSQLANGSYQNPERLPEEVNTRYQNCDSYVAPDESYLVFTAFHRRGHDRNPGRLCVAFRNPDGTWRRAQELGPDINTVDQFGSATISADGRFLFFPQRTKQAGGTGLDIFWVAAKVVLRQRLLR